ncbi:Kelch repeat-containing protein [Polyangium spumosum]|uniref:Kelch-like protein n=1 Tax=Polyangium spumosum TaxID=889282 RepID=A0A6N7Q1P8_9BACT|nr:kelch repeat-containing protein [Polyangium spumosum]MRG97637.1 hypothetical protein [Polyangium spumosum]
MGASFAAYARLGRTRVSTGVLFASLMTACLASGCGDAGWNELAEGETATSIEAITYSAKAMSTARYAATGTVLPDGRVLVAGGRNSSSAALSSAQIYNPATDAWSSAANLPAARTRHTATLLGGGRVLVAGGSTGSNTASTSYLYNPSTNAWTTGAGMSVAREEHTATLLANGKVLVVGGGSGATNHKTAALYTPATNTWANTGSMAEARRLHTAVLLDDGRVLVTGGRRATTSGFDVSYTSEIYNPATGTWSLVSGSSGERHSHTATRLANGKVLIAGGLDFDGNAIGSRIFDPATGAFTSIVGSAAQRYAHSASLLPDGRVLLAGGRNASGSPLSSAHLFNPATNTWQTTDLLQNARSNHIALNLQGDRVLFIGGLGAGTTALTSVEISRLSVDANLGSSATVAVTGNTCGGNHDFTPSCTSYSHEERAYLWQAPSAGEYVFSTIDAGFTLDTILYVLDARTDAPLASSGGGLACNDDAPGTKQSKVTVNLASGQRVLAVVEGYGAPPQNTCGSFKLSITSGCKGGDPCTVPGKQGVCAQGVTQCVNGVQSCAQVQEPSIEVCDELDNDCDGLVDEFKACLIPQEMCCSSGPETGFPCSSSADCGGYACKMLCPIW